MIETASILRSEADVKPGDELNPHNHTTLSDQFSGSDFSLASEANKRTILLMNCHSKINKLFHKGLICDRQYEILNSPAVRLEDQTLEALEPYALVVGLSCVENELERIKSFKKNPSTREIPLVIFCKKAITEKDLDELMSVGVVDCICGQMTDDDLKLRLKSTIMQLKSLNEYRLRDEQIQADNQRLASKIQQLLPKLESGLRESRAHLELLNHAREVNDAIVGKIEELKPFMNVHGKSRLRQILQQIRWELNEEEEINLERKLDEANYDFYRALETRSSNLTKYEKRLCAYLKSNNSSADIARVTRKTANCINVAFARIRAKLNMRDNNELKDLLKSIEPFTSMNKADSNLQCA